jgi:hypothetical protein
MAQSQAVIMMNDTAMPLSQNPITLNACVSYCGTPASYQWSCVGGNPVVFSSQGAKSTVISGFKPGLSQIAFTVKGTDGKTAGDTLTLAFVTVSPPTPCPPPIICPTCPPIPKQRTANSLSWDPVHEKWLIGYDDGSPPTGL